jgi:hypothetical protein
MGFRTAIRKFFTTLDQDFTTRYSEILSQEPVETILQRYFGYNLDRWEFFNPSNIKKVILQSIKDPDCAKYFHSVHFKDFCMGLVFHKSIHAYSKQTVMETFTQYIHAPAPKFISSSLIEMIKEISDMEKKYMSIQKDTPEDEVEVILSNLFKQFQKLHQNFHYFRLGINCMIYLGKWRLALDLFSKTITIPCLRSNFHSLYSNMISALVADAEKEDIVTFIQNYSQDIHRFFEEKIDPPIQATLLDAVKNLYSKAEINDGTLLHK